MSSAVLKAVRPVTVLLVLAVTVSGLNQAVAVPPPIWEPDFGVDLGLGDDTSISVNLGFDFPFLGTTYDSVVVGSNGVLTFGVGDGSGPLDGTSDTLRNGSPEIAVASYDLNTGESGEIDFNTFAGRAVVTWDQVPEFSNGGAPNTFQAQLYDSGRIVLGYDVLTPLELPGGHRHSGVVGVSPGGGAADPGEVDYSFISIFDSGSVSTVYEFFDRGPNGAMGGNPDTWDLASGKIIFEPNDSGGWTVRTSYIPEPCALLLASLAGLMGCLRRRSV